MGLGSDQPIPFIISWFVGVVFDLTDHEFSNYRLTIDDIASGWEQNIMARSLIEHKVIHIQTFWAISSSYLYFIFQK